MASTVRIAPGVHMPMLGLGTYKAAEGPQVEAAVESALQTGYRAFDTASVYGNEAGVGRALSRSGLPRSEYFLTTKVWNDAQGYEETLTAFEKSRERLDTEYVDLYLVHWPIPEKTAATWRAMEEIHASGGARAIGVCNHLAHHLETLCDLASVPPAVNQFEFHPRLQQPEVVAACVEHGVTVQAWAPIMRGAVSEIPEVWEIAKRHGKSATQVAIRWILQRGIATIPKSVQADRIRENAAVFDFVLDAAEAASMDALDAGERIGPHPDSPPA